MAVTVDISNTMTTMWNADSTTGWTNITPAVFSGFQREGTYCLGAVVSNTTVQGYYTLTSFNFTSNRVYIWINARGEMDTLANGGIRILIGDGTNRMAYHVGGGDYTTPFVATGGWQCYCVDYNNLPTNKTTIAGAEGSMSWTAITQVGVGFKTLAKSLGNVENCFWDIGRYGTGLVIKGGGVGTEGTWAEIAADDESTASGKAYGIIMEYQTGVYGVQGDITFGDNTSTTSTYFKDNSATVVFMDSGPYSYSMDIVGNSTGTNEFEDGVIVGSGDTARGRSGSTYLSAGPLFTADFSASNVDVVKLYGTTFKGVSEGITFGTTTTHALYGCTFSDSGQVNIGSVIMRNCTFSETSADNTDSALLWNENINIKNCNFIANSNGSDAAAIEHPSAAGSPYDYYGMIFSGNDYDVYNSSGSAITINLNDGSNATTSDGSSVTFITGAVTTTVTVKDIDTNSIITGARVFAKVSDGTNFPYDDSVTITQTGGTATVSHTAHGLSSNDYVVIEGANEQGYNGVKQITVTGANAYTYTCDSGLSSPATGTITSTYVPLYGTTDGSGQVSQTKSYSSGDQIIEGWVRSASSSPYYKTGPISATIDNGSGASITILLIRDE